MATEGKKAGLIILGNSGVGKSYIANVLAEKEQFEHKYSSRSVTRTMDFLEVKLGPHDVAIFDIPGLVEADQAAIERNKVEIDKAFAKRPLSIILYVFGCGTGGRITSEGMN